MANTKFDVSKKIQRQICIVNFLKEGVKTSKELLDHLESKGHSKSTTTLSNDIQSLRDTGFKIDKHKKGYYALLLDDCIELYSHFIKYQSMAIAYQKALKLSPKHMQYISFEPNALEFNIDAFNDLFEAIKTKREVTFNHIGYHRNNQVNNYTFTPYLLKEYQNRWYAIGKTDKGYRTFSIDRISNLKITSKKIKVDLEDLYEELQYVIGVSFNPETTKANIVQLKIDNSQKEYIKTTPFHRNQEILEENDEFFILKLFIVDTIELHQQILRYGSNIEVIAPKSLREKIKKEIGKTTRLYA